MKTILLNFLKENITNLFPIFVIIVLTLTFVVNIKNMKIELLDCKNAYSELNATHNELKVSLTNKVKEAEKSANQTQIIFDKNSEILKLEKEIIRLRNKNENATCDSAITHIFGIV